RIEPCADRFARGGFVGRRHGVLQIDDYRVPTGAARLVESFGAVARNKQKRLLVHRRSSLVTSGPLQPRSEGANNRRTISSAVYKRGRRCGSQPARNIGHAAAATA